MQDLRVDARGDVWDYSGPKPTFVRGPSAPAAKSSGIFTLPQTPEEVRAERRKEEDQALARGRDDRGIDASDRQAKAAEDAAKNQSFDNVMKLRGAYESSPVVKEYRVGISSLGAAMGRAGDPTGDVALIYDYAKAMDPGSVVREAEMGMAASGGSVIESAVADYKRKLGIEGGGTLSPELREKLKREIATKIASQNKAYSAQRIRYAEDAKAGGIDPRNVTGDHDGDVYMPQIKAYHDEQQGDPAPNTVAASGPTREQLDPRATSQIDSLMNAGASRATVNAVLKRNGHPGITPGSFNVAQKWIKDNPGKQYFGSNITKTEPLNLWQRAAGSEGGALVARGANAATAGLMGALGGAETQGALDAMAAANPNSAIAGDIIGSFAGAGAMSLGAAKLAARVGTGALRASPLIGDTAYGALSGFNAAQDGEGGTGALIGAGAGLGGSVLGQGLGRLIGSGSKALRRGGEGYVSNADKSIYGAVRGSLPEVRTNLADAERLNLPYGLVDASPKARILGGAVTRKSVDARDIAERTFDPRQRGQSDRAIEAIDTHLAPQTDIAERGAMHLDNARTNSKPFYTAANERAAPVDDEVAAMLRTPAGQDALQRARGMAGNDQRDPNAMGFDLDDQGEVVLRDAPSFETLDLVKQGFDARLSEARDVTGRLDLEGNPELAKIEGLRQRYVGRLDQLNDQYPLARGAYAEQAQLKNALDGGFAGTTPKLKPRDTQRVMDNLRPAQVPEYQRGYATSLSDQATDARLVSNPYSSIYGSPNQMEKMGIVFPQGAPNFPALTT